MQSLPQVREKLLNQFRQARIAQVPGYKGFGYLRETEKSVYVSREAGKDSAIPFRLIDASIMAVRDDNHVYHAGPSALRAHGITYVTSPIWAILHLAPISELCK